MRTRSHDIVMLTILAPVGEHPVQIDYERRANVDNVMSGDSMHRR
jgi:hypothetical protein